MIRKLKSVSWNIRRGYLVPMAYVDLDNLIHSKEICDEYREILKEELEEAMDDFS